ncbi:hypothetical protein B0T14DRAFT_135829 [Immersiella caudata]|uniref:NACHT domain-containing protein n=1 Tax=Immersiella caudata TaxID=314043 RepID=A0AA39X4Z5_9PEZI|nr:hypothetical protein B0T14DRAFT_135829 [Immersiella caudata]
MTSQPLKSPFGVPSTPPVSPQPTSSTFARAVEKFSKSLTEDQKKEFKTSSLKDVEAAIRKIQERYGPEKKLRGMRRVAKFLEAMSQLEHVIKVFLNVSEVVAFIWGPIKLGLLIAGTKLESLERLLDIYVEIGELIPSLKVYDSVFRSSPAVLEVLELYFQDMLQFHANALDVFTRPAWKDVFHSTWKTFESHFAPIRESLRRHRTLLLDLRVTAGVIETQNTRKEISKSVEDLKAQIHIENMAFQQQLKQKLGDIKLSIEMKLDVPTYTADHQEAKRNRLPSTGDGILKDDRFVEWCKGLDQATHLLYVHGKPGAGKTIVASRIIDHLQESFPACRVLFFYFRHHDESKTTMTGMLRALLAQLLCQDDSLSELFHKSFSSMTQPHIRSLEKLQYLLTATLKSQRMCFIVLDGLDECVQDTSKSRETPGAIVEWFEDCLIPACHTEGANVRLLLSGQRDGVLDQMLKDAPAIGLDDLESHKNDIHLFIKERASKIRERFSMTREGELSILKKVSKSADGMFLYAKVVLGNLMDQDCERDVEEELQDESFPHGLEEAYQRVLLRVVGRGPRVKRREAVLRILGWILCSARPLYWREIQTLFCLGLETSTCDARNLRVETCKAICGSFVEVICDFRPEDASESTVRLVHETAGSFLLRHEKVNLVREHEKMVVLCCRYLSSPPFSTDQHAGEVVDAAKTGYYGFQDYATAFWQHHIRFVLGELPATSSTPWQQTTGPALDYATEFLTRFRLLSRDEPLSFSSEAISGTPDTTILDEQTIFVRTVIESINPSSFDTKQQEVFARLQGNRRFKCPKRSCYHFASGFQTSEPRDRHVTKHERPFKCPEDSCYARTTGFASELALKAHIKDQHARPPERNLFPGSTKSTKPDDIWTACAKGDVERVRLCIANKVNLRLPQTERSVAHEDRGGLTPLIMAARHGRFEICRLLVENGAGILDCLTTGRPELTEIGEAIRRSDLGFFEALLTLIPDTERTDPARGSPGPYLYDAVLANFRDVIPVLVSWHSGQPPDQIFRQLLQRLAHSPHDGPQPKGALEFTHALLFPKTDPGYAKSLWYPSLVEKDQSTGSTLLHLALTHGCEPLVLFLVDKLEAPDLAIQDHRGNTPLHVALRQERNKTTESMLTALIAADRGCSLTIRAWGWPKTMPLWMFVNGNWSEHGRIADLFVNFEAIFPSAEDDEGYTVLQIAARLGKKTLVEKLLASGKSDPERITPTGLALSSVAAGLQSPNILQALHAHDPSLLRTWDRARNARTPFYHAVSQRRLDNVKFLLQVGESEALIRHFWRDLPSVDPDALTGTLLRACLELKRTDLTRMVLQDLSLELAPIRDWQCPADDESITRLMMLRGPIAEFDLTDEQLVQLDNEADQFLEDDCPDAHVREIPTRCIDSTVPLSSLISLAIYCRNKPLLQWLASMGHLAPLKEAIMDMETRNILRKMGIAGWARDLGR